MKNTILDIVQHQTNNQISEKILYKIRSPLLNQTCIQLNDRVWHQIENDVWSSIWPQVYDQLENHLTASV